MRGDREWLVPLTIGGVALLSFVLAAIEYWMAQRTGAIALEADAWHNVTDVTALGVVALGWKVSRRPVTSRWPEGRPGVEDLAQLCLGLVIAGTAAYVAYAAWEALRTRPAQPQELGVVIGTSWAITIGNLLAAVILLVVGRITRTRLLRLAGKHAAGDSLASMLPSASAGLALIGAPAWVDAAGAAVISLWLVHAAWEAVHEAAPRVLVEQDRDAATEAIAAAAGVDGVLTVLRVRTRWIGPRVLALNVVVLADRLGAAERVRAAVGARLAAREPFPEVRTFVHNAYVPGAAGLGQDGRLARCTTATTAHLTSRRSRRTTTEGARRVRRDGPGARSPMWRRHGDHTRRRSCKDASRTRFGTSPH